MKFQTKIILYYTSIALALSLLLGVVLYKTGLEQEMQREESALATASTQLLSQMEDRLGRMEAIIYYVLSDADMLSSMKILGMVSDGTIPVSYIREAEETMRVGLSTAYLLRNSYRSGFYNQIGFQFSSFVLTDDNIKISKRYQNLQSLENLPYLQTAVEADGKTVVIGAHPDPWAGEDGIPVYSVMKAVRGYQMGFLEVENTIESLAELDVADPLMDYLIFLNGEELIFHSQKTPFTEEELDSLWQNREEERPDYMLSWDESSDYPVTVLAVKSKNTVLDTSRRILGTALLVSLAVFTFGLIFIILYSRILVKPLKQFRNQIAHTSLETLSQEEDVKIDSNGMDELEMVVDTYRSMTRRLDEAVENEKRSLTLQMQAQFDTLQAQINPHFIYNILNIISSRGIEDNDDLICEICNALAMILRYSTGNKERQVLLEQEIRYLEHYLYLCKVRYGKKLEIQLDISPQIYEQKLPKLTLQQFVENSLVHGFNHQEGSWKLWITGKVLESGWEIVIRDNGEGIAEEKKLEMEREFARIREIIREHRKNVELEMGGMGLVNTFARCLLFFGEDLVFEILPCEQGAGFRIGTRKGIL